MRIEINPVAKPRQTRSDVWKQRPAVMRYRAFADELRLKYTKPLPESVTLIFYIPMPKSWSATKKTIYSNKAHRQKPDIDNLIKSVLDALLDDDSKVWHCNAAKYWSYDGGIEIQ